MIRRSVITDQQLAGLSPPLNCPDLDWQPRMGCHVDDMQMLAILARPNLSPNQEIAARSDVGMLPKLAFPENAN